MAISCLQTLSFKKRDVQAKNYETFSPTGNAQSQTPAILHMLIVVVSTILLLWNVFFASNIIVLLLECIEHLGGDPPAVWNPKTLESL